MFNPRTPVNILFHTFRFRGIYMLIYLNGYLNARFAVLWEGGNVA